MRQLTILSFVLMLLLSGCRYDDTAIIDRIEKLESRVATIDEQIAAIHTTIDRLEDVDEELERLIAEALKMADENGDDIAALQQAHDSVDERIDELRNYVDREIQENKSWVSATYATLKQYKLLADDVASLNATMVQHSAQLSERIDALEDSMQSWVNSQFANYYTIAEVEALLDAMQESVDDKHGEISSELKVLSSKLNNLKVTIAAAYTKAIEEAITANNGVIEAKIAEEIERLNDYIDGEVAAISRRIEELEQRVKDLEDALNKIQALDIEFDIENNSTYMPGAVIEFGYVVVGGDEHTVVECWSDGGWIARVTMEDAATGYITVTTTDSGETGKVVVLATSGVGGVCMKSIYFDKGVIVDIKDRYDVGWEMSTVEVSFTTNLEYDVRITDDAKAWLSVVETRAELRGEVLTFAVAENDTEEFRCAVVELVGDNNEVLKSFEIKQDGQPSHGYILFADEYVKSTCVAKFDANGDGELSYLEASKVHSISSNFFGDQNIHVTSFDELAEFVNVTAIESFAFSGCTDLRSIVLPYRVTSIGQSAFYGCSSLQSISIPDGVTKVESGTFMECSALKTVTMSVGIATVGDSAFMGCDSLQSISLPAGLLSIGSKAFRECGSLRDINIPDSVTMVGDWAFRDCVTLQSISFPKGVTAIEDYVLSGCSSITSVGIPEGVTAIGSCAFSGCKSLARIDIPSSVASIGNGAFSDCQMIPSITIPNGITSIDAYMLSGCVGLKSVVIPESVVSIGSYAFKGCSNLQEVTLPSGVQTIGSYAFYGCSGLRSAVLPQGVTSIDAYAFYGCGTLCGIVLPDSVLSIGQSAFEGCAALSTINIPKRVTVISPRCFYRCGTLQRVTIHGDVTSVGNSAFSNCSSLSEVYVEAQLPPAGADYMFYSNASGRKIYVPKDVVDSYKNAAYWSVYAADIAGYDFGA